MKDWANWCIPKWALTMVLQRNTSCLKWQRSKTRRAWWSRANGIGCETGRGREVQTEMNLVRRLTLTSRAFRSIKAWIWRRYALVLVRWRRYKHFLSKEFQSRQVIDECVSISLLCSIHVSHFQSQYEKLASKF